MILLLSPERAAFDGIALDVVRVALTIALADLSLRALETPIRTRRVLRSWRAPVAGGMAMAAVAALAIIATSPSADQQVATTVVTLPSGNDDVASAGPSPIVNPAVGTGAHQSIRSSQAASASATAGPVRALVAGDSTAVHLSAAMLDYATAHPADLVAGSAAFPGCGLTAATDGRMHQFTNAQGRGELIDLSGCTKEWTNIPARVRDEQIQAVIVSIGPWDAVDIHLADGTVVSVADPTGRQLVLDAYRRFIDSVRAAGATVLWIRPADAHVGWGRFDDPLDDPARWSALRSVLDELAVRQIDLPTWLATHGLDGKEGRPDGVHLTDGANTMLVADLIAPALQQLTPLHAL